MWIPINYEDRLNYYETELLIKFVKDTFEKRLAHHLNLMRVSAPLFVRQNSGLNDNLNGVERPVVFDARNIDSDLEVVHSLAKWKRLALKKYDYHHRGIYTDMNAIRRDEDVDNIHSFYVDQWDWEKIILEEDRTLDTLKRYVTLIIRALKETEADLLYFCDKLNPIIDEDVFFITTQELEDMFPGLTSKEREDAICRMHDTVCLMQIGGKLKSGKPHDLRGPDYDDWSLNCDILINYPTLDHAIEISSMGIRVDRATLLKQLKERDCLDRLELPFHKALMSGELPFTIGGGIGQSRICLLLLNKAHIGEVQACVWPQETYDFAKKYGIHLL